MSKVGKRRYSLAAQNKITSQECGEHRNSKHRCPSDCAFNLFAPSSYSQLLEAEASLDQVAFKVLTAEPRHGAGAQRRLEKVGFKHYAFNSAVLRELFFVKDASGLTFGQRWERTGFPELKNGLRCLFRAKMGMYLPLMEVQRVLDADSIQCRDLFNPARAPFTVFDRSAAGRACRHDVLLGHCYDLPHFTRFFGTAIPIPFLGTMEPEDILREIVAHLGGPVEARGFRPGWWSMCADSPRRLGPPRRHAARHRWQPPISRSGKRFMPSPRPTRNAAPFWMGLLRLHRSSFPRDK